MRPGPRRLRGFSLIELMVATAIAGLLTGVAYPSFSEQLQRARRADAWEALGRLQLAQEHYRSEHTRFADSLAELNEPSLSAAGHYRLRVSTASAVGFTLEAEPLAGSPQARDRRCVQLRLVVQRGSVQRQALDHAQQDSSRRCFPA